MKHSKAKAEVKEACHILAETIMRFTPKRHSQEWVKAQLLQILLDEGNIEDLTRDYTAEYDYAEVQNPYLAEVLKEYDQEVN